MRSIAWTVSSFSMANGNCVQVGQEWRMPSRSYGTGQCAEVANASGVVFIRDSKDPDGVVLSFDPTVWTGFTYSLR
jgi:Domain of unknown function (DUF397)